MYCQSCGAAVAGGLVYCPRCGASLGGARGQSVSTPISPDSLIWGIITFTVVVLGLILGGIVMLKSRGVDNGMMSGFMVMSFLAMFGVDMMLIRLLLSLKGGSQWKGETAPLKEQAARDGIGESERRALAEPFASVTEQTTRAFEPVGRERKWE